MKEPSLNMMIDSLMGTAHWQFGYNEPEPMPDTVLMQFTGLLDKNGKEVFEGDILSMFSGTQKSEVYWREHGLWEVIAQLSGGSLAEGQLLSNMLDTGEVIGNIYENPELLTSN